MSEPASFVLIRDGQKRYFADRWANCFLFRELVWGSDSLENWLAAGEELDEWFEDADGGAVIDYDRSQLIWYGDAEQLKLQRVARVHEKLVQTAWPDFNIRYAPRGNVDLALAAAESVDMSRQTDDDVFACRMDTVRGSTEEYSDDDDEDVDTDEEDDADSDDQNLYFADDDPRAWITVISEQGTVRHWQISEISQDLLRADPSCLKLLAELDAGDVPAEATVAEGIWIDHPRKQVGFYGGYAARALVPGLEKAWKGWNVRWADNGYAEQCAASGPGGKPMSDEQALGKIVPILLSTKRIDAGAILGMLGSGLKRTAIKGIGCLTLVVCAPVMLFGLVSGNIKAALITIAIVVAIVVVAFNFVASRLRKTLHGLTPNRESENAAQRAPVVGPLNTNERRSKLDALLVAAGFPRLSEVESYTDHNSDLDLLLK